MRSVDNVEIVRLRSVNKRAGHALAHRERERA